MSPQPGEAATAPAFAGNTRPVTSSNEGTEGVAAMFGSSSASWSQLSGRIIVSWWSWWHCREAEGTFSMEAESASLLEEGEEGSEE